MTIVQVLKLRSGISRAEGAASIQECAVVGSDYENAIDAAHFVEELIVQNDHDASSANAGMIGLKLAISNPLRNNQWTQFKNCFHFTVTELPEMSRLKLFRVSVTEKITAPHYQSTVQHNSLMILACTKAEAFQVVVAEYPKCASWDIKIKEINGPFTTGQIIMDIGIRVLSTITDPLLKDF